MTSRRKMTEREVKARMLNKKEERVLAKTFGTLNLEMGFMYNVLSLHVRTVKANYKRLRERADKLRSNLSPQDITMLRKLEEEGKFKPASTFNVNAAMKIAAAAHRLNIYPEGIKRSNTTMSHKRTNDKLLSRRSLTEFSFSKPRSNSVTGVFIDAPQPDTIVRRSSVDLDRSTIPAIRPVSAAVGPTSNLEQDPTNGSASARKPEIIRPSTSNVVEREHSTLSKVSFKTATPRNSYQEFSTHDQTPHDKTKKKSAHDKLLLMDVTDESLDSGRQRIFEDRRQELLNDEQQFLKTLVKRKNSFLGRIDEYLQDNPPAKFSAPLMSIDIPQLKAVVNLDDEEEIMKHSRRRRNVRTYDVSRTFTSEEEYKAHEKELWKDMNKTRYLRVPDDKLDLSGVVTLAKDQMRMFKSLHLQEQNRIVAK
ncbi:uncharacterized protein LOC127879501 [Dreissena polymorpha]|uniref:Uncharacterized protein n=1 Tax=Dreissena polymorpha TaxID=45954 RepID=A0A9D4QQ44_DREPO|nr:uncharacterized protein LOC127879501 [Dreissena polymorpha]XP_052282319.1 uncharacterized protein LOC127879501 [Dreissena polymorpha]XP_052282320.1 uncharacterized protein LOC127879501 [Dreissena polymorpha]XP_052282321.1 uncharacterized protein LOC127879501 [Dreissena polymorpha]XP_052282322.1 uncharacterized protein LOC127879501 [Dreissena polymorpha]XP_052282323.1 uncharacterized protein LOC127879501 [Dreissena polymorpha]KAH3839128.1 hypothetical protein DPMN_112551 [Dreissena polymorp